ncbi:MAG: envelope biogenesis factor ElyC [Thermodesulfobacteriota bacterium]
MFLLKKLVAPLLYPVPLCLEILGLGLVCLWFSQRQKLGKTLVSLGTLLLALFSYNPVAQVLLQPLEQKYPGVTETAVQKFQRENAAAPRKWIVVLGGGAASDPRVPLISRLSEASRVRLLEGVRLYREMPGSKLILSGGRVFDPVPEAEIMARVARALGVPQKDILVESLSRDTADEARLIKGLVGSDPVVLVTSAAHLPRSLLLFEKQGLKPLPYPVGHQVKERRGFNREWFFPDAGGLAKTEAAFHEYLGLAWLRLQTRFGGS